MRKLLTALGRRLRLRRRCRVERGHVIADEGSCFCYTGDPPWLAENWTANIQTYNDSLGELDLPLTFVCEPPKAEGEDKGPKT